MVSESHRFHGEPCGLLKTEEKIHGVNGITGRSLEQIVYHSRDEQTAVDLVEMDDTLVGVDDILEIGDLGGDEREVVIIKIVLIELDDLGELERTVELAHSHDTAGESSAHRHHVEARAEALLHGREGLQYLCLLGVTERPVDHHIVVAPGVVGSRA